MTRIATLLMVTCALTARAQTSSQLWGEHGERWSPASRLPDFSRAGYHEGADPLPEVPVITNVRDHGAKGDGATDDAPALINALAAVPASGGAVFLPAGRYVLGKPVVIERSNVVLRGAGEGKTVLVVPRSLQELSPKGFTEGSKLGYSFGGAFIQLSGKMGGRKLANVAAAARRGESTLTLSGAVPLRKGDAVRILMNNDKTLGRHLHGDLLDAGEATFSHRNFVDATARVASVDGIRVTLDRPLRTDVRPEWAAEIWSTSPTVREVGVERLSFEFPGKPKQKHLQEEGFNAVQFIGAVDCWVRNVTITDSDLGVKLDASRNCTVTHVTVNAAKREDPTGHHAFWVSSRSQDNLFDHFDVRTKFVHDLSVEGFAHGNVFAAGRGVALNLDHHRNGPYANLFTDLHTTDVSRLWASSGRGDRGPHSGAWSTVWNLSYDRGKLPPAPDWPLLNVVGVRGYEPRRPGDNTPWVEPAGGQATPKNLYEAQRRAHAGR